MSVRTRWIDTSQKTRHHSTGSYANKLEASAAQLLDEMVESGKITEWTDQHTIAIEFHDENGRLIYTRNHKVDFLALRPDGSKLLIETKGAETDWYKELLKLIDHFYLKVHLDTDYEIWKQKKSYNFWG